MLRQSEQSLGALVSDVRTSLGLRDSVWIEEWLELRRWLPAAAGLLYSHTIQGNLTVLTCGKAQAT